MSSFFVIAFSWCAPRECTLAEAKSIGCKVTKPYNENSTNVQYLCFTDIEEYVDGSPKNIPHCITTYPITWTVDTKLLALDHYHGYISNGFEPLKTAVDDHSSVGLKQRIVNGKLNTRVNGDMATIGATVMIQRDGEYNFDPSPTNGKSSTYSEKILKMMVALVLVTIRSVKVILFIIQISLVIAKTRPYLHLTLAKKAPLYKTILKAKTWSTPDYTGVVPSIKTGNLKMK